MAVGSRLRAAQDRIRARNIAAEIKFRAAGAVMRRYEILTLLSKT
ncbi:hypothetical protein CAMGR0001_0813 [Campylobacter gracilis RM3268]|uniref:Uncharacterized protein n=1 Tax=Campylobacter gracilis RM3268 TaxID=553220 RepID=C8PG20_9BACT|nr:hypothetical protein CAMGR0001_0813 [Campylobacter gracilis RM3268]